MVKIYQIVLGSISAHGAFYAYQSVNGSVGANNDAQRIFSQFCYGVTQGIENTIINPAIYVNDKILEFKRTL